jgi:flagellar motor switch protein FliM
LQTLKPIASQLRSRVQSDKSGDNLSWRQKLERAILNIPLTITARLAQPRVSMRSLIQMQRGDVFPIQISGKIDVLLEGRPMFEAELGEINGQAALNLKNRIKKPAD